MKTYWETSNELHKEIGLCESEVDAIIEGMNLIINHDEVFISDNDLQWYTHIKSLFESFKQWNY